MSRLDGESYPTRIHLRMCRCAHTTGQVATTRAHIGCVLSLFHRLDEGCIFKAGTFGAAASKFIPRVTPGSIS